MGKLAFGLGFADILSHIFCRGCSSRGGYVGTYELCAGAGVGIERERTAAAGSGCSHSVVSLVRVGFGEAGAHEHRK